MKEKDSCYGSTIQTKKLLSQLGYSMDLPKKHTIIHPSEHSIFCYYLRKGIVDAEMPLPNGGFRVLRSFSEGQLILGEQVLTERKSSIRYQTKTLIYAQRITRAELLWAMQKNSDIALAIIHQNSVFMEEIIHQTTSNMENASDKKLAALLIDLWKKKGIEDQGSGIIVHKLTQDDLAQMTGLHRVTVCRVIRQFKENGLLEKKEGYYCLPDPQLMMLQYLSD